MRKPSIYYFAFVLAIFSNSVGFAQEEEDTEATAGGAAFNMEPFPDDGEGAPYLLGGAPASGRDWPATFRFKGPAGNCTSTAVGPRVILTAAHCVTNNGAGSISSTRVVCSHHPKYIDDFEYDIAACITQDEIRLRAGAQFETINLDPRFPSRNGQVMLLGFGCRRVGGGGESGALYQGPANVKGYRGAYIVTTGGAALCFGDSGGGAFVQISETRRRMFAINSRGDINFTSYLTPTHASGVATFLDFWAESNGVQICGLNLSGGRCRQ